MKRSLSKMSPSSPSAWMKSAGSKKSDFSPEHADELRGDRVAVAEDHDPLRAVADDFVGHRLGPLHHIGKADVDVRIAVDDSPGFFPAGMIAAGTAVPLILGPVFSDPVQDVLDLLVGDRTAFCPQPRIVCIQDHMRLAGIGRDGIDLFLMVDVAPDLAGGADGAAVFLDAAGAADAAVVADIHL